MYVLNSPSIGKRIKASWMLRRRQQKNCEQQKSDTFEECSKQEGCNVKEMKIEASD